MGKRSRRSQRTIKKDCKACRSSSWKFYPDLLAEEQRNCPYCHVGSNRPTYPLFDGYSINNVTGKKTEITVIKDPELPIFVPGLEDINYETEYDNSTPVMNYCPMCGRPLSGDDGRNERIGQSWWGGLKNIAISVCRRVINTLIVARLLSLQRSIIALLSRWSI